MKRIFLTGILISVFFLVQAQTQVYDEANDMQRQRMVYRRWDSFVPGGFFNNLWYWSVFHPGYKKNDLRPLGPVGPYVQHQAFLQVQDNQDLNYKLSTDTIARKHLVEDLNSQGGIADFPYNFYYKERFESLQKMKDNLLLRQSPDVLAYMLKTKLLLWYNEERAILDDRINVIHSSYMDRGSRILAYQRIEAKYSELTNQFTKVTILAKNTVHAPVKADAYKSAPIDNSKMNKSDQALADAILDKYKF